jgi:3-hydroxyacyl-[acyl-carrier-protein] dehydratase
MLINDLYTIEKVIPLGTTGNKFRVVIRLNPDHDIFKGHFPGNPVLPGVCIIQILKEIVSRQIRMDVLIDRIISTRFLSMINPEADRVINFDLELQSGTENYQILCNTNIYSGTNVFCRYKGTFRVLQK